MALLLISDKEPHPHSSASRDECRGMNLFSNAAVTDESPISYSLFVVAPRAVTNQLSASAMAPNSKAKTNRGSPNWNQGSNGNAMVFRSAAILKS